MTDIEAACQRNDYERKLREPVEETIDQRIAYAARMVAMNAEIIGWEDWRIGPHPARFRQECRDAVVRWGAELAELTAEMKEAA